MSGKILFDWIEAYNKKAGEQFTLLPNATMWANNEHGIVTWEIKDGEFWLRHCSCDYKYWLPVMYGFIKSAGFNRALTLIKRNTAAYTRLTGARYIGDIGEWHLMMWEVR